LAGRRVLVTGAAGSIGIAVVHCLVEAGARVVTTDIETAPADELAALRTLGPVIHVPCDIREEPQVVRLVDAAVTALGGLDGAANVAGIVGDSLATADFDAARWQVVLDVNLRGTWLCMKHEIAAMLANGSGGAIVNIASIAGHAGEVERSPYVASKAGVVGLTKTAAVEYARLGIRVNAVSPGPIDTPQFHANVGPPGSPRYAQVQEQQPIRRLGKPREIAEAIAWLISDRSSFVIGHELIADGGLVAEGLSKREPAAQAGGELAEARA
jgi:NAD(P)-dependent dehydrogenase (short-subunit alcohol dehydrogenase family)